MRELQRSPLGCRRVRRRGPLSAGLASEGPLGEAAARDRPETRPWSPR